MLLIALIAAAVTAIAVVYAVRHGSTSTPGTGVARHPTTSAPATQPGSTTTAGSTAPTTSASATGVPSIDMGFVPLYPFENLAAAQAWEVSYREGGHQPWHADAGQTAVAFSSGYLRFTELDQVTSTRMAADGAHVGVGYRNPAGTTVTAAVVHLMRYGTDSLAPWEVVGTDDTTFTLDEPAYASHVHSPVSVGGRITGVDESIVVAVRQLQRDTPLGQHPGVPAGGQDTPWRVNVSYAGAAPGALMIVASAGGHVRAVERFAVTGVFG